jgi:uncharacterized membrane protein
MLPLRHSVVVFVAGVIFVVVCMELEITEKISKFEGMLVHTNKKLHNSCTICTNRALQNP